MLLLLFLLLVPNVDDTNPETANLVNAVFHMDDALKNLCEESVEMFFHLISSVSCVCRMKEQLVKCT